jgi:hypothetical protein
MPEQEQTKGLPFDLKGITGVKSGDETEFKEVKFKEAEDESEESSETEEVSEETSSEKASAKEEVSEAAEEEAEESSEEESEAEETETETEAETEAEEETESSEEEIKTEDEQSPVNIYELSDGVFETEAEFKSTAKLLKENPELKGMLDFYEKNGTLLPYLQATQIDPDKISDESIMWESYKAENAGTDLDESDLRMLFEEDVLSLYETEDESRAKILAVKKKRAANELRERVKEDLKALLLPRQRDANTEEDEEQKAQAEAERSAKQEASKNKLSFQIRKEIKDGKLDVKVNDQISVKLEVSPRKISQLLDSVSDPAFLQTKEGSFDLKRMAILADPDAFINSVVTSSKSEGKKEFVNTELKARPPKGKVPEGNGSPSKPIKRFDPRDKSTWGGITSVKPAY